MIIHDNSNVLSEVNCDHEVKKVKQQPKAIFYVVHDNNDQLTYRFEKRLIDVPQQQSYGEV